MALLEVEDVSAHYGRVSVLHDIDISVEAQELAVLVGANGAGKSTLMRTISGLGPACEGTIRFEGRDITGLPAHERVRLGIAQVPEGRQVFPGLSVEDNLALGAYSRTMAEVRQGLAQAYEMFPDLATKRRDMAGMLSGGQQQMLVIGRALMSRPRLLLLDEPSMGLAPRLVTDVFKTIKALKGTGVTIFLVEQNARAALRIADRAFVMENGWVVQQGSGRELLQNDGVRQAYLGL